MIKKTNEAKPPSSYQDSYNDHERIYSNGHIVLSSVVFDNIKNQVKDEDTSNFGLPTNYAPPRPSKSKKFVSEEVRRFIDSNLFDPNADSKADLSLTKVA